MTALIAEPAVELRPLASAELEVCDCGRTAPHCTIMMGWVEGEDHPSEECCGDPAVASVIISCPDDHAEPGYTCGEHLQMARDGELNCVDCDPITNAFLVAEMPL